MKKIGFVTYRRAPQLTADDALAVAPLAQLGLEVIPTIWDDPAINWKQFDGVIIRSCWDYHHKPGAFRRWIEHLKDLNITLWNSAEIICWNMEKKYLQDLAEKGVRLPPTIWLAAESSVDLYSLLKENHFEKAVLKPTISATAWQTWLTSQATARHDQLNLDQILCHSNAMVQKFVEEIISAGEWSLIFFGGKYSHAALKRPQAGDFRVQEDFGGTAQFASPPPELIKQAETILRLVEQPLLYARVDGVDIDGKFTLIELELIEPHLFLRLDAAAPHRFAAAVAAFLNESKENPSG